MFDPEGEGQVDDPVPRLRWGESEVTQHARLDRLDLRVPLEAAEDVARLFESRAQADARTPYTSFEVTAFGGEHEHIAWVGGVEPGGEAEVRAALEAALEALLPEIERRREAEATRQAERSRRDEVAARMTETFRGFAEES
jgi:hypothetical protein